jgi:hypothetical protein
LLRSLVPDEILNFTAGLKPVMMNYIIFFATHWGYVEGGINSFNYDMVMALGDYCRDKDFKVVCVTYIDPPNSLVKIANAHEVDIHSLNKQNYAISLHDDLRDIKKYLDQLPDKGHLFFVGHDVFTGELANYLAADVGSKATGVVIHHMDYEAYYAIKGDVSMKFLEEKITSSGCRTKIKGVCRI